MWFLTHVMQKKVFILRAPVLIHSIIGRCKHCHIVVKIGSMDSLGPLQQVGELERPIKRLCHLFKENCQSPVNIELIFPAPEWCCWLRKLELKYKQTRPDYTSSVDSFLIVKPGLLTERTKLLLFILNPYNLSWKTFKCNKLKGNQLLTVQ